MGNIYKGARVTIVSNCATKGLIGTIQYTYKTKYNDLIYAMVLLDNGMKIGYRLESLVLIEQLEEENVYGYKKVAIVKLPEYNQENIGKRYGLALYENAEIGDLVICNPRNILELGKITQILPSEEYEKEVTREIISVVDISSWCNRMNDRKNKKLLKEKLDKKINKLKDIEFYEKMADRFKDKDPEIESMVESLKKLER